MFSSSIMSITTSDNNLQECRSNSNNGEGKYKYYCAKYTEKPFGLEKHQFRTIQMGIAHVFGLIGSYLCYTLQYPSVLPVGEFQSLKIVQIIDIE